MSGKVCHFHTDEWSPGNRPQDGNIAHICARTTGHPDAGPWRWLEVPEPASTGLSGFAEGGVGCGAAGVPPFGEHRRPRAPLIPRGLRSDAEGLQSAPPFG